MPHSMIDRRQFLAASSAGLTLSTLRLTSISTAADVTPKVEDGVAWYNVEQWGVEGKGWPETARYFDRLPAKAEKTVRAAVWGLSRHSAGMLVRFETNSPAIQVRYTLMSPRLEMSHMPATGVSGIDLYARDADGKDRWLSVARPASKDVTAKLVSDVDALDNDQPRLFTAYLPLYNGVDSLEIGVNNGTKFQAVAPRKDKPLVFYGTSIMHGACASRPGMSITGILGRRLDRPTINLGFSGNGKMEIEVGKLLAELDPSVYVIDCLPNMTGDAVAERTQPLVRQLKAARPKAPILLVEDRTYTYARFRKSARERHTASRAALRQAYEGLTGAGVKGLYYLGGEALLGDDGEAATDGSHPNDLGMMRYADAYEKSLRGILT